MSRLQRRRRASRLRANRLLALGAVASIFLLLSASTCSTSQPFSGSGAPKIQFFGDSITFQSTADINAHYGGSYDVAIEATVGTDTFVQAPNIAALAARDPDIVIINFGTNDARRIDAAWTTSINGEQVTIEPQQTVAEVTARLDAFAAAFASTTCVVFVTVNSHNPSWSPANAAALNDHLRVSFPHLADWDAAWQQSYFAKQDDPHPNAQGRQALLALADQAIEGCVTA